MFKGTRFEQDGCDKDDEVSSPEDHINVFLYYNLCVCILFEFTWIFGVVNK